MVLTMEPQNGLSGTPSTPHAVSRHVLIDHFGRSAGVVPVALVAAAVALWAIGLAAAGSRRRARADKRAAG